MLKASLIKRGYNVHHQPAEDYQYERIPLLGIHTTHACRAPGRRGRDQEGRSHIQHILSLQARTLQTMVVVRLSQESTQEVVLGYLLRKQRGVMKTNKIDCPMCLFSSGVVPYTGSHNQTCSGCFGTGKISKHRLAELKEIYHYLK